MNRTDQAAPDLGAWWSATKQHAGEEPPPHDPARERVWCELRAAAKLRPRTDQADAAHLPLFVAANEPKLL